VNSHNVNAHQAQVSASTSSREVLRRFDRLGAPGMSRCVQDGGLASYCVRLADFSRIAALLLTARRQPAPAGCPADDHAAGHTLRMSRRRAYPSSSRVVTFYDPYQEGNRSLHRRRVGSILLVCTWPILRCRRFRCGSLRCHDPVVLLRSSFIRDTHRRRSGLCHPLR